ncbi:hypothetical protein GUITHDRAFT_143111 [Guillardia theta CCMP2712]|uniref:PNPLA domain-containing protein n=1 Tax=Guillardia theta (strain CCMP2712) TaxID=905079 RepID=L1IUN8_GUITC|nr:hypothetical protein GUITHDRAFT_143111 [Guillardia theta CCMP2712]EKX39948.1 hypothetical protein GUITHDRAFT_143111 [Guillardia theta CCMP2712]|eukprot:XP_005826928.1 hypothetical protein GUITHDRAFT_143111 [Guillardia theta CCMP2712]
MRRYSGKVEGGEEKTNFNFSGSGFLLTFHAGAADVFLKRGIIKESSTFSGASGGAIISAALATGISPDTIISTTLEISAICRQKGTVTKVGKLLEEHLRKMFKPGDENLCSGRVALAVSRVKPRPFLSPVMVRSFHDRDHLISTIMASCFIPGYLSPHATFRMDKDRYIDGALVNILPPIRSSVNVLCFKKRWVSFMVPNTCDMTSLISPDIIPNFPYKLPQMVKFALFPATDEEVFRMFQLGQQAAELWLDRRSESKK